MRIIFMLLAPLLALMVWLGHEHLRSWVLLPIELYPVLTNVVFLGVFGYSLFSPPSIIERIARLREPTLSPCGVIYTRRVTQVWCVFFIINGAISLMTMLWASAAVWSFYNGVLSYVLMGLLFAGEYIIRIFYKRRHAH